MRIGSRVDYVSTGRYPRSGRGKVIASRTGRTGAWLTVKTDAGTIVHVRPSCAMEVRRRVG